MRNSTLNKEADEAHLNPVPSDGAVFPLLASVYSRRERHDHRGHHPRPAAAGHPGRRPVLPA